VPHHGHARQRERPRLRVGIPRARKIVSARAHLPRLPSSLQPVVKNLDANLNASSGPGGKNLGSGLRFGPHHNPPDLSRNSASQFGADGDSFPARSFPHHASFRRLALPPKEVGRKMSLPAFTADL